MRRRWLLAVLLLLVASALAALGVVAWAGSGEGGGWAAVERRDLVMTVAVTGELEAEASAQLGPPQVPGLWNFTLTFMAPEGSTVEEGEPVLRFDDSQVRQNLESALAELETAEQELAKLAGDLERRLGEDELTLAEAEATLRKAELKLQVPDSLKSGNELRAAEIEHRLAETEVLHRRERLRQSRRSGEAQLAARREQRDRARSRVELIRQQLASLEVRAPRGGTVIYLGDGRGEKKKPGDSCWWGERVMEIPDLTRMTGRAQAEEVQAGRLQSGQQVRLRLDAFPDHAYRAEIRAVRTTVQQRSFRDPRKVVGLDLRIEETDAGRMRPGMRFQGTVEVERLEDVLAIPLGAVEATREGPVVTVEHSWGSRRVRPDLGRRNEEWVEVLAGLAAGDRVRVGAP